MLTIIIPIYNVERYIEKCTRSLMEQTLKDNVEFLFINDCTPDNSMKILYSVLQEYPDRANQITIINNGVNIGISDTRKKALSLAKGDYIGWCDSDDWCEPEMFEMLIQRFEDPSIDIAVVDYWYESSEVTKVCEHSDSTDPKEALAQLGKGNLFPYQLWETVIKKTLLQEGFAKIKPTMSGEDSYAMMIALFYARNITYIHRKLYHHLIISTSLSRNIRATKEEWLAQKINITYIEQLYGNKKRFSEGLVHWKILRKRVYVDVFNSLKEFYEDYPEIEWTKPTRYKYGMMKRIMHYIISHYYPVYWIVKRKYWRRNKREIFGNDYTLVAF